VKQESLVVHQMAKARKPDFALADMSMTIDARVEIGLGIIEMKREDFL
jgi:hypothetical protein